ncbi:MAG: MarR family transcriptional regulator [Eubacteriaceae bacterium]|jgi:DNA-binding MarR family transcriptional regulator|nr:MarR family transcriptional regulator [Eubacteriaceae bacterium]
MSILKWFSITDRHIKKYLDLHLAPYGINSSQHLYILKICDQPGITQERLIEDYYIHPSNVTRALNTLEEKGYVRRESCEEDKRKWKLYPMDKAWDLQKEIIRVKKEAEAELLKGFTVQEQRDFSELLKKAGKNAIFNIPL